MTLVDSPAVDLERLIGTLAPVEVLHRAPVDVLELAYDTRAVASGSLFFCLRGERVDGHDLAGDAVAAGAAALVVERPLDLPVPQLVVADSRQAMAKAAGEFFRHPSQALTLAGVTGRDFGGTSTLFKVQGDGSVRFLTDIRGVFLPPVEFSSRRKRCKHRAQNGNLVNCASS